MNKIALHIFVKFGISMCDRNFSTSFRPKSNNSNNECPGLVVMGGDSCSKRSRVQISAQCTEWTFFTFICCKNCIVCFIRPKITEKEAGNSDNFNPITSRANFKLKKCTMTFFDRPARASWGERVLNMSVLKYGPFCLLVKNMFA